MIVRSPAWIIVLGALVVQASGILTTTGQALIGIDGGIRAVIDFKALATKITHKPIKVNSIVIPKQMPTKAHKQ